MNNTIREISQNLNKPADIDALLQLLAQPAIEAGAREAILVYISLNKQSQPEWAEFVAFWRREDFPLWPIGERYYIPEFPLKDILFAEQESVTLIVDYTTDERLDETGRMALAEWDHRAIAVIPLIQAGYWSGLLIFEWAEPHQFSSEEKEIYQILAGLAPPAVENLRLVDTLEDRVAESMAEVRGSEQQIIEAQQQVIQELSTPIIPIMDRIIIMPVVGSIDSTRARNITRTLLSGISQHRAKVVILDITGVDMVDTSVAGHLDKTIRAARLKGAQTIITGVSDAVAETIVALGIDWSQIETVSDLQTGLRSAIHRIN